MVEQVKVLGVWGSPFSRRVEIALKMKGVEYVYIEENLQNKSDQLLKYNPIHKKIPVFLHNGKLIVESLIILEYIDETWKKNPLLPVDPYERAQAHFWALFLDDKLWPAMRNARVIQVEDNIKAMQELHKLFMILEDEIKDKDFFGGDNIGFVDIVALFVAYWFPIIRDVIGKEKVLTFHDFPRLYTWTEKLLNCKVIKDNLPDKGRLIAFFGALHVDSQVTKIENVMFFTFYYKPKNWLTNKSFFFNLLSKFKEVIEMLCMLN